MKKEIWKDVVGYEGLYKVSSLGRIKSLNYRRTGKEKVLKLTRDSIGYLVCSLWRNNKKYHHKAHRLIAQAFIVNDKNKIQVNHIDGNKDNNNIKNLEWCTTSENLKHLYHILGYKSHLQKKVMQYDKDLNLIKEWESNTKASIGLGINKGNISSCCTGRLKTAGGFIWKMG